MCFRAFPAVLCVHFRLSRDIRFCNCHGAFRVVAAAIFGIAAAIFFYIRRIAVPAAAVGHFRNQPQRIICAPGVAIFVTARAIFASRPARSFASGVAHIRL